ncbi:hypothetical protein SDD30_02380 [Moorella naiadis]|uniref:hypothetical protein n=1 Tax=Moorella naiadis (nom. illeg.) TaxID=3093670 RepID=UPI003D9C8816
MEELLRQLLQGQEEIKVILQQHGETLQQHGDILQEHSVILQHQSETLQHHSEVLQQQSEILHHHSEVLEHHSVILQHHSEVLQHHSQQLEKLQQRQLRIENSIENEIAPKINALFDAFELRGDQIEKLQKHLDGRLDAIAFDVNYLLNKTARQETAIIELKQAR